MYKSLLCSLLALLVTGCLGDGGGSAYEGDVGTETPANQGGPFDVGNEAPANQGGPFDVGYEDGGTSAPSGAEGDDLFDVCMETCVDETDADYCREEVCAEFDDEGGPPGPQTDACENLSDEEQASLDLLPVACRDCICSGDLATAGTRCLEVCS